MNSVKILAASVAVAGGLAASPVLAQDMGDDWSWYVSLFAGATQTGQADLAVTYGANNYNYLIKFNPSYTLGIALGTTVMPSLRAEVEVSGGHAANAQTVGDLLLNGVSAGSPTYYGSLTTAYFLANLWYEIDLNGVARPYIGGGVGAGLVSSSLDANNPAPPADFGGNAIGLAAQIGAGVVFDITDNIAIDLGYRAKGIFGATLLGRGGGFGPYAVHGLYQHSLQGGLTVSFN